MNFLSHQPYNLPLQNLSWVIPILTSIGKPYIYSQYSLNAGLFRLQIPYWQCCFRSSGQYLPTNTKHKSWKQHCKWPCTCQRQTGQASQKTLKGKSRISCWGGWWNMDCFRCRNLLIEIDLILGVNWLHLNLKDSYKLEASVVILVYTENLPAPAWQAKSDELMNHIHHVKIPVAMVQWRVFYIINYPSKISGLVHTPNRHSPCMVLNAVHHLSPPCYQHLMYFLLEIWENSGCVFLQHFFQKKTVQESSFCCHINIIILDSFKSNTLESPRSWRADLSTPLWKKETMLLNANARRMYLSTRVHLPQLEMHTKQTRSQSSP